MKWASVIVIAALACVFGLWWAKSVLNGLFLLSLALVSSTSYHLTPSNRWIKSLVSILILMAYLASSNIGVKSSMDAYNDCVDKGEYVREQLSEFYSKNKQYPETLNQLPSFNSCKPILHSSILKYQRTHSGYNLSFDDGFIEHRATESDLFMAHK